MERVRLWNSLVFAREWFYRTAMYSNELEQRGKRPGHRTAEFCGRKDINDLLRFNARKMYYKGVTNEQLLMYDFESRAERKDPMTHRFRALIATEQDVSGHRGYDLEEHEQIRCRDEIYTSNVMRDLWTQLYKYDETSTKGPYVKLLRRVDQAVENL